MYLTLVLSVLACALLIGNIILVFLEKSKAEKTTPEIKKQKQLELISQRLKVLEKSLLEKNQLLKEAEEISRIKERI